MNKVIIFLNTSVLFGVWTNVYISYLNLNLNLKSRKILEKEIKD